MGVPFSQVVIGVENLADAISFFDSIMGLDTLWQGRLDGEAFTTHWNLPAGAAADAAVIGLDEEPIGRILLLDFGGDRETVRAAAARSVYGLYNLNFHVDDCFKAVERLREVGIDFWAEPVKPDIDESQGGTVECFFDGPGGVAINLVELTGGGPETTIGQMRVALESAPQSRTNFTPVATSTHAPKEADPALAFYRDVLGMAVVIDQEMGNPATNAMLGRPENALNRIIFLNPGHLYGKIVLSQPVNYEVEDAIPRAAPPNIGYLAQSFVVDDLDNACVQVKNLGGDIISDAMVCDLPGMGSKRTALVTCPGSGALIELIAA